jgi:hypothetical protein
MPNAFRCLARSMAGFRGVSPSFARSTSLPHQPGQGSDSRSTRCRRRSIVRIWLVPNGSVTNMARIARSKATPWVSTSGSPPLRTIAAVRARDDHSPPANWAMASSGSQTSNARSFRTSITSTWICSNCVPACVPQALRASRIGVVRGVTSRCTHRATVSPGFFRRSTIEMQRSATVSGRVPIPASTFGQKTSNAISLSLFLPPHRSTVAPRR